VKREVHVGKPPPGQYSVNANAIEEPYPENQLPPVGSWGIAVEKAVTNS